jgi:hypothetical protein
MPVINAPAWQSPDIPGYLLRVFTISSPMSVGSWLLSAYVPATGLAAASVLIGGTAVPAWHDGYQEMPFVLAGRVGGPRGFG